MNRKGVVGTLFGLSAVVAIGILKCLPKEEPTKYSHKWFETLPDGRLDEEREIVRQAFCSAGGDLHTAVKYESLLSVFDAVIRKRRWGDKEDSPPGFPVHREHGWYLPNDD